MIRRTTIPAMLSAATLALGSTAIEAQTNLLTDLGAVAPGLAINNSGQVALQSYLYSNGTLTQFPTGFTATGINASGAVVGSVLGPDTPPPPRSCPTVGLDAGGGCAFATYANGTLTGYPIYMGPFDPAVGNQAQGINSSGQIVGDWTFTQGEGGALLLSGGTYSALTFPSGICGGGLGAPAGVAYAINDAGQIAGLLPIGSGSDCPGDAFLLTAGTYTDIGPGAAQALNATGQVVGYLYFGSPPPGGTLGSPLHAFLYGGSGGAVAQDLGTLPGDTDSAAYAINSSTFIVGASSNYAVTSSTSTAFFYNGVMNNLNTFVAASDPLKAFVTLTDARGINDSGLIVVNGVDARAAGAPHAYLLQVPLIQVAPGPLSFRSEPVGSVSPPQTVTLTNAGPTSVTLGAASVSGSYRVQSNSCGSSLAAAASCAIAVVFAPVSGVSPVGSLTLLAAGVPISVPLLNPLSASITVSPTAVMTGTPVTLMWSATAGAVCVATGGAAGDGWAGAVAPSGSRAVTEATAGTYTYGISCFAGSETQTAQTAAVVVSWAPVLVTITASPTTLNTGQSMTLTWSSKNATTCASSGGGSNDGWPSGSRATSGNLTITEPNPVISGGSETLTFVLTCQSSVSGLSGTSSVKITQLDSPASPARSGGGGAMDALALLLLSGMLAARWVASRAVGAQLTRSRERHRYCVRHDRSSPGRGRAASRSVRGR
jgi:hypothetical protein